MDHVELNNFNIDNFILNRRGFFIDKQLNNNVQVIIDFYNVYCNFVKFNKYKVFSKFSVIKCLEHLIRKINLNKAIIVTKSIYEFPMCDFIEYTRKYKNITVMIVDDILESSNIKDKCKNRERDDFICLYTQYILDSNNYKNIIISNDKFSNFDCIISNIRPCILYILQHGRVVGHDIFDNKVLSDIRNDNQFIMKYIHRIEFHFKNKR